MTEPQDSTIDREAERTAALLASLHVGDRVRAFHPRTLGVVLQPTVAKVGRKYVHCDFGSMWGGTFAVAPVHVIEIVERTDQVRYLTFDDITDRSWERLARLQAVRDVVLPTLPRREVAR